ncbi:MAG: hypothetical protein H7Y04_15890 [Verrucomicrobia bacterium]|nr:hypothetical protein [Cytophagales bacterium]
MKSKAEKSESPEVMVNECKVIRFVPNHEFQMTKTDGNPESEALIYDLFLQAAQPLSQLYPLYESILPFNPQRA